jgi:hypothetical protein
MALSESGQPRSRLAVQSTVTPLFFRDDTRGVKRSIALVLATAACGTVLWGQPTAKWESCPVISRMPAGLNSTDPLEQQQRFELRQCGDELVIVTAYENQKRQPSLVFETGDGYPRFLAHAANVLVLQSMGGASDHVYVFAFQSGKPSVALKTATKDLIEVKQSHNAIAVLVPPTTYPEGGRFPPQPPPKEYSFPLHR